MARRRATRRGRWFAVGVGLVSLIGLATGPGVARGDDKQEAAKLVQQAKLTVESFATDKQIGKPLRDLIPKAKGVFVAPSVLRGAFIIGVSGGSGVLLARGEPAGKWNGPAFYTMGEASFGLQAGGDASEVILLAMTERGVSAMLSTSAKLGADASVAAGPVGAGATAATANLSADILTFSRAKGLYGGVSVEGAVVATRGALNTAYYGKEVSPTDILVRGTVSNKEAASLIAAVAKLAKAPPPKGR
jgi:lipid-binding SYLF domain-containing protein